MYGAPYTSETLVAPAVHYWITIVNGCVGLRHHAEFTFDHAFTCQHACQQEQSLEWPQVFAVMVQGHGAQLGGRRPFLAVAAKKGDILQHATVFVCVDHEAQAVKQLVWGAGIGVDGLVPAAVDAHKVH